MSKSLRYIVSEANKTAIIKELKMKFIGIIRLIRMPIPKVIKRSRMIFKILEKSGLYFRYFTKNKTTMIVDMIAVAVIA